MDLLKLLPFSGENENSLEDNIGYKTKNEPDLKDHKTKSGRINTLICEKRTLEIQEKRCKGYKTSVFELKDEKTSECTICSYKAKSRKTSQRHRKIHVISNTLAFEGEEEKTLEYSFGYKVKNERALKDYKTKNGSENTCEKKTLKTYENRDNSYKASTYERQNEKFFECTICSYKAKSQRALQRHRKTHIISSTPAVEGEDVKTLEYYVGYKVKNEQALKDCKKKNNGAKLLLCRSKDNIVNESVIGKSEAKIKPGKSKRKKNENTFTCKFCSYRTISKEDLASHKKIHSSVDILECKYCGFICPATDFSERHKCTRYLGNKEIIFVPFREKDTSTKDLEADKCSHNVSAFKCKDFPFDNATLTSLKRQNPKQKDMGKFKCTSCKYKSKSFEQLNSHMVKHSKKKKLNSEYCDYKCLKSDELKLHLHTHVKVKRSPNMLCSRNTSKDLRSRNYDFLNLLKFYCYKAFLEKVGNNIKKLNSGSGNEKGLILNEIDYRRCVPLSNYKYKSPNEICRSAESESTKTIKNSLLYFNSFTAVVGRKYIELHNSDRIFRCIFCCFTTSAKSYLKEHIVETHKKPKFLKCEFCSFKGTNKACIWKHMKNHAIKKVSSELSGDTCFVLKDVQFNLSKNRTGCTLFQCEHSICKCNRALNDNKEIHSNKVKRITVDKLNQQEEERKFGCMFCGYKSTTNSNLKTHVSLAHKNELPFECIYCNYTSATPDQRKHSKVHSNGNTIRFRFKQRKCKRQSLRKLIKPDDIPTLKCALCGFCNYEKKTSFSDHAMTHVGQSFSYRSNS